MTIGPVDERMLSVTVDSSPRTPASHALPKAVDRLWDMGRRVPLSC